MQDEDQHNKLDQSSWQHEGYAISVQGMHFSASSGSPFSRWCCLWLHLFRVCESRGTVLGTPVGRRRADVSSLISAGSGHQLVEGLGLSMPLQAPF